MKGLEDVSLIRGSEGGFGCAIIGPNRELRCFGKGTNKLSRALHTPFRSDQPIVTEDGDIVDSVIDISLGISHVCAILASGIVACIGDNEYGQLGTGDAAPRAKATKVDGIRDANGIDTVWGDDNCIIDKNGAVYCWGSIHYRGWPDALYRPTSIPTLCGSTGFFPGGCIERSEKLHCPNPFNDWREYLPLVGKETVSTPWNTTSIPWKISAFLPIESAAPEGDVVGFTPFLVADRYFCATKRPDQVGCWRSAVKDNIATPLCESAKRDPTPPLLHPTYPALDFIKVNVFAINMPQKSSVRAKYYQKYEEKYGYLSKDVCSDPLVATYQIAPTVPGRNIHECADLENRGKTLSKEETQKLIRFINSPDSYNHRETSCCMIDPNVRFVFYDSNSQPVATFEIDTNTKKFQAYPKIPVALECRVADQLDDKAVIEISEFCRELGIPSCKTD